MNLNRQKKFSKKFFFCFLPLIDSFVGDAVVNLIPLGLIYSLVFDDVCVTNVSWDVGSTFEENSSDDGTIIGKIV
jgi:hypothetical protein